MYVCVGVGVQHQNTHTYKDNYKHIKYQRLVKQTKVNTLQEGGTMTPYKNQSDQARVIYTGNKSEFKSHWVPH